MSGGGRSLGDVWTALFTPPPPEDMLGPFWLIALLLFAAGFVISVALSGNSGPGGRRGELDRGVSAPYVRTAASAFGIGLFFFGVRLLRINLFRFAAPIWLLLCFIGTIAYLAWATVQVRRDQSVARTARPDTAHPPAERMASMADNC